MAVGATKPPHKRRKTSLSPNSTLSSTEPAPHRIIATPSKCPGPVSCTSCHRLYTIMQGHLLLCSRCSAPTCAICSRTCTARVPSQPPTPHLTWSPSPSPPQSPRNSASDLESDKLEPERSSQVTGKRRKDSQDDFAERISNNDSSDDDCYGTEPGCGRIFCRDCCIENIQSNTISCYDCYGC